MPKFIVTLQVITWYDYEIDAENLAEAEAIAKERRGQEGWKHKRPDHFSEGHSLTAKRL